MFADQLLSGEQIHLVELLGWGGASVVVGTAVLALLAWQHVASPLLRQFAIQIIGWGVLEVAAAAIGWHSLAMRDLAGATRLDRMLWLEVGLDVGCVGIGATLVICGWVFGRRLQVVGAGLAAALHGVALLVLQARLATLITR